MSKEKYIPLIPMAYVAAALVMYYWGNVLYSSVLMLFGVLLTIGVVAEYFKK